MSPSTANRLFSNKVSGLEVDHRHMDRTVEEQQPDAAGLGGSPRPAQARLTDTYGQAADEPVEELRAEARGRLTVASAKSNRKGQRSQQWSDITCHGAKVRRAYVAVELMVNL